MFDLFSVPWTQLEIDHVRAFLDETSEEGVTWEAKGGDDAGKLRPEVIQRAACGLANQLGGYLILGAYESGEPGARTWELRGLTIDDPEPRTWIGRVLRGGLRPAPRFEIHAWTVGDGRHVMIVQIEPIAQPPCMTIRGQIFERVSGETLPVKDPAILATLVRRGEQERERAIERSGEASNVARWDLDWPNQRSVSVALAIAPVGRQIDEIDGRLFTDSFRRLARDQITQHLVAVSESEPRSGHTAFGQHAVTLTAEFPVETRLMGTPRLEPRIVKLLMGRWDGTVVAAAHYASDAVISTSLIEDLIVPGWHAAIPLLQALGGYGPAHLTVAFVVASEKHDPNAFALIEEHTVIGDPPPDASLFSTMPDTVEITRWIEVREPTADQIASLHREMQRAAGRISLEPE